MILNKPVKICVWEKIGGVNEELLWKVIAEHNKPNNINDPLELKILKDANKLDLFRFGDILNPKELCLKQSKRLIHENKVKYGLQ